MMKCNGESLEGGLKLFASCIEMKRKMEQECFTAVFARVDDMNTIIEINAVLEGLCN